MAECIATANLDNKMVSASVSLGKASLFLSYPRFDEEAAEQAAELVAAGEELFALALEALAEKVESEAAARD